MATTSVHFCPCKVASSELHNERLKSLDYVNSELSDKNESFVAESNLCTRLQAMKDLYQEKVGQRMQAKSNPIMEGVVVMDEQCTMSDLKAFADVLRDDYGLTCTQIHIHNDEGHYDEQGNWMPNRHAHIIVEKFDWNTGRTIKLSKQDMSDIQTKLAKCLRMQRGEESTKKHIEAKRYKIKELQAQEKAIYERINNLIKTETALETALKIGQQNGIDTNKLHKTEVKFKPEPITQNRYGKRSI